jgi:hypothetical protein
MNVEFNEKLNAYCDIRKLLSMYEKFFVHRYMSYRNSYY